MKRGMPGTFGGRAYLWMKNITGNKRRVPARRSGDTGRRVWWNFQWAPACAVCVLHYSGFSQDVDFPSLSCSFWASQHLNPCAFTWHLVSCWKALLSPLVSGLWSTSGFWRPTCIYSNLSIAWGLRFLSPFLHSKISLCFLPVSSLPLSGADSGWYLCFLLILSA